MMKAKSRRIINKIRSHKLVSIVVLSLIILIIMAVGAILYANHTWDQYSKNYIQQNDKIKIDIDSVAEEASSDKIASLTQLQSRIKSKAGSLCDISGLVRWQAVFGQNSAKIKDCEQKKENLVQLSNRLGDLVTYLALEEELSATIKDANSKADKNNQPSKWTLIGPIWRQAAKDIENLSDADQFKLIKKEAKSAVVKIADAWEKLAKANSSKNRQDFVGASAELRKAYLSLEAVADDGKTESEQLISSFNDSYRQAFQ